MNIVISPYSRKMRNGARNPKDYPYWPGVIARLVGEGHRIHQIGVKGETELVNGVLYDLSLAEIKSLIKMHDVWLSVDNFLPHLANHVGKPGIVLFGKSDPDIFGYPQNVNLLKDRKYLREKQFDIWESTTFDGDAFVDPSIVINAVNELKGKYGFKN